ncbi:7-carboxy-7-deazaguanine synthase QueE [Carboxydothermus hydrogenoformans]|uniref:7-carboxy-7-deazaguanine synthase n=1 Tax=Carboxydothermus hydrogenoformans (strain ATCC BAA-161 / DSM 6008 / Z-2901) TaxID=246194 RepID=Q3ADI3_CARHZ|nr:7-carboxy-7-deazaguanine synthase QueE [Carboxydothermus hydrogenoformans]ABB14765.1 radical SAM domain protein [Carboxydothermus hydrogenoformans Z-2901]
MANIVEIFPSLQGEGLYAGVSTLFIRFSGCNLNCSYCDTEDAREKRERFTVTKEDGSLLEFLNPVTPEKLVEILRENYDFTYFPQLALTGGEPLLHASFLKEFLPKLSYPGEVLLETNGTLPDKLNEVLNSVDIISQDFKLKPFIAEDCFTLHREFLQEASRKKVYVKMVISPEVQDSEFNGAINEIALVNSKIPLILQPVMPINYSLDFLFQKQKMALKKLWDVRIIPQVHKLLQLK